MWLCVSEFRPSQAKAKTYTRPLPTNGGRPSSVQIKIKNFQIKAKN